MPARSPPEHLVFAQIIDAFFTELGPQLTPALREKIKKAGIDLGKPLQPAYPVATFEDAMEVAARELMAHLPLHEAFTELGRMQIRAFSQTFIGRATLPVFKLLVRDHERMLKVMTRGFRQANNYVETRVERLGDGHYRLWFNDAGQYPEIFLGLLEAGADMLGAPCDVRISERDGLACWYEVRARASA